MCITSYEHAQGFIARLAASMGTKWPLLGREVDVRSDPADMHKLGQLPDTAASIKHTSGRRSPTSRAVLTVTAGLLDLGIDLLQRAAQSPLPVLGCTTTTGG